VRALVDAVARAERRQARQQLVLMRGVLASKKDFNKLLKSLEEPVFRTK
jgi:hypothetical protein